MSTLCLRFFLAAIVASLVAVPSGSSRLVGEGLDEYYDRVLTHLLGRAGPWRDGTHPPSCSGDRSEACETEDFIRIPGTPHLSIGGLRVVALLESFCPLEYNSTLETRCQSREYFLRHLECQEAPDLPHSMFRSSETQRTVKGYYKSAYTAALRRLMPYLREKGWSGFEVTNWNEVKFNTTRDSRDLSRWPELEHADIIITTLEHFREMADTYTKKRFILISTNDAATISEATRCDLDDPRILAVLQHTALNPIHENNKPLKGSRRHFMWLPEEEGLEGMIPAHTRDVPLSKEALSKVKLLVPQIYRWKHPLDCGGHGEFSILHGGFEHSYLSYIQYFRQRYHGKCPDMKRGTRRAKVFIPWECKKYDISYVATINNGTVRQMFGVNAHRDQAVNAIRALQKKHPHLNVYIHESPAHISYNEFAEILRDSRVFVSPFGLGEFSGKDYEAMLAGAVLAKPGANKIVSYPNIYSSSYSANVAMDFSDLEEKIMSYLGPISKDGPALVSRGLKLLEKYASMEQLADDWHAMLLEVAGKTVEFDPRGCHPSAYWMYRENQRRLSKERIVQIARMRLEKKVAVYTTDAKHHHLSELQLQEKYAEAVLELVAPDSSRNIGYHVVTG